MKIVLIIDDEPEYRKLLGDVLEGHGWQVLGADAGDEGIRLAKTHRPAVVLCDLLMPRCNGFQVCRSLRNDASLRETRIVVASGRDFESDRNAALEAGADAYLTKPLDFTQLVSLLSQLAGTARTPASRPAPAQVPSPGTESRSSTATRVRFWGVRGSIPTPGPSTVYYGGNTSCVEVRANSQIIILDAGTGLRSLGRALASEFGDQPLDLTLLLTHTHWDHIQGLPFFQPFYRPQDRLRILGYEGARHGLDSVLTSQMQTPFFPVGLGEVPANVEIEELKEMEFEIGRVRVQATFANHPGICVGYRLSTDDGSLAYFPDNEPFQGQRRAAKSGEVAKPASLAFAREKDSKMVEFLRDVDVLVMDSQYDCDEYKEHIGWGHGCVNDVVALALQAQVKRLYLFHHDPDHDDAKVSQMLAHARDLVAAEGGRLQVEAAREGAMIELASPAQS